MKTVNNFKVATQLNAYAESHPVGRLQEIRMRLARVETDRSTTPKKLQALCFVLNEWLEVERMKIG